jgi:hypothetical protein
MPMHIFANPICSFQVAIYYFSVQKPLNKSISKGEIFPKIFFTQQKTDQ